MLKSGNLLLISQLSNLPAARSEPIKDDVRTLLFRHNLAIKKPKMTPSVTKRRVRVSLYTNVITPYLVVFDSSSRFAQPITCLKLINCLINRGSFNDVTDDCCFHIVVGEWRQYDDVTDRIRHIDFRASSMTSRDEWFRALTTSMTMRSCNALPTLKEDEDEHVASSVMSSSNFKTRSNSLNSILKRLRRQDAIFVAS